MLGGPSCGGDSRPVTRAETRLDQVTAGRGVPCDHLAGHPGAGPVDKHAGVVDRIEGDVSLSGPAEAPVGDVNEPIDLRGWELGDGPVVEATIAVDADQAAYARHILGDVVDQPDGSVTATLDVRNIDAFRSFVLSFLEHAEILEPADLRNDFVEWLEAQQ